MVSANGMIALMSKEKAAYIWTIQEEKFAEMLKLTRAVLGEPLINNSGEDDDDS